MSVGINTAAIVSHIGKIRANNQDSGYAGKFLFVIADGMGGHAGGDVASAVITTEIRGVDHEYVSAEEALETLTSALVAANKKLAETVVEHSELTGMGTTASAIIRIGARVALAHIGDSRIYLFRDHDLTQVSHDHTFVQRLVEMGRITKEEALTHPRRSVVMKILGDGDSSPEIDSWILDTMPGDRWLVCSDGLSGVVPDETIRAILDSRGSASQATELLLQHSLSAGAPDNVTIIVLDIDDVGDGPVLENPITVGSAALPLQLDKHDGAVRGTRLPTIRLHPVRPATGPTHFEPQSQNYLDELIEENARRVRRRRTTWIVATALVLLGIVLAAVFGYQWTQSRYFVGESPSGYVAIFQGVQQNLGPISLSHLYETSSLRVTSLPPFEKELVRSTINSDSLDSARSKVRELGRATQH